jgi:DNA-directed RNA polymerase specialized sigma24 family protein
LSADTSEFAQFIKARSQALQRTAWLLTGDWGLAEDLVQTALARSWPRWERINRRDDPEVYVRRVMINTWRTWSRRRWRGEKASSIGTVKSSLSRARALARLREDPHLTEFMEREKQ